MLTKQEEATKIWNEVYKGYEDGLNAGNAYPNEPLIKIISTQRKKFTENGYFEDFGSEYNIRNHFNGAALEIGFGSIANLKMLTDKGYSPVIGIEVSEVAVARGLESIKKYNYENIELQDWIPTKLKFEDDTFNFVCGLQCIYYNLDLEHVISEVRRVLKPGGTFAFSFFSNKHDYIKYIDVVDGDLVKWSSDHPNFRIRGAHFRQAKDVKSLKQFFKDFKDVRVFTEESDFTPMFHSWWYITGTK
tara:strand:- start:240 stop:977 length:738 start_codon:yes stop_codon:yes gene_type:complete